ncbi:MAG: RNA chaperone Hfq [Oscillospiraceae bacterium]|nr:RNA chaperone Hfq [Oscillospiraceae bacterium]
MPNTRTHNLQDYFLNAARSSRQLVTVFLVNGFQLRGTVTGFDSFTVVLDSEGKQQLIYKHAISTIIPTHPINLSGEDTDSAGERASDEPSSDIAE